MTNNAENCIPLVVVAGPTASGKTALAVELCRRFGGEVISADSMQVYDTLRVGTARPSEEEQGGIPHHLMGFLPPDASYSVAKYAEQAHRVIKEVHGRGKLPVLCGGTGLYIQAVTENLSYEKQPENREVRDRLRERIEREGGEVLLGELSTLDPETAARLHPNDHGRIIRALEIIETTGRTITRQNEESRKAGSPYALCGLRLEFRDRERLYDRINRRVTAMLENGLEAEARWLREQPNTDTVRQAIGYKELEPYLTGAISLDEAADAIRQGTRRYAKRQLSWFRHQEWMTTVYMDDADCQGQAMTLVETFLRKEK
ncbi:MAG: tRNA (adenosine(37)-N6)-dimethylallyltransferase MiaA [Clostridia bacterium]|nr:tRNA (adenosine(37)-N6)-dimethylallyltransferase MiaA [Clostridia bacterium]